MDPFSRYLPALETEMRAAVAASSLAPPLLRGMLHYHLGWMDADFRPLRQDSGKHLRPVFLLLACESQGGDWRRALPAAAAVELLHNFSLIHDDIEDRDVTRRGRATLWALWGEAQAINAGDALFAVACHALARLRATGLDAGCILEAQSRLNVAVIQLTGGQCLDISFETGEIVPEETYLRMVGGKTATLLGYSCELGGLISGAAAGRVAALQAFGYNLGLAFQMQDDLLGLWGDPARTGKPVGADLRQHKKTLPILHGLQHSAELRALLAPPTLDEADIVRAQAYLEAAGSREYTLTRAREYHRRALAALEQAGGQGEAQEALHTLAQHLLSRDK